MHSGRVYGFTNLILIILCHSFLFLYDSIVTACIALNYLKILLQKLLFAPRKAVIDNRNGGGRSVESKYRANMERTRRQTREHLIIEATDLIKEQNLNVKCI